MGKIILYHGTSEKALAPQYGLGEVKHDYGKGFYLTESLELAKEWAVCKPNSDNGWVHKFELETRGLKLFDYVAHKFPEKDTAHFIKSYMVSKTRRSIDESQAYVNTMSAIEL